MKKFLLFGLVTGNLYAQPNYEFSFSVIGDPQIGIFNLNSDTTDLGLLVRKINDGVDGYYPSFTLVLGDLVHHADTVNVYESLKLALDGLDSTYYVVPGNHDYETDGGATAHAEFESVFTYPPAGTAGNDSVYSFVKSSWFVIGVDTGDRLNRTAPIGELSAELRRAENAGKFGIVFSHYGLWQHPNGIQWDTDMIKNVAAVNDTLHSFSNMRIVVSGHRHLNFGLIGNLGGAYTIQYVSVPRPNNAAQKSWIYHCYDDGSYIRKKIF